MTIKTFHNIGMVLILCVSAAYAAESAQDARKYMVRGVAAIEMAKTPAELEEAAAEFVRATELDPSLAAAWYNLGSIKAKLGDYNGAIASYKRYLSLVPKAEDASKIQDEIIKLEFRQEKALKSSSRQGTWVSADGTPFILKSDGNGMTLETDRHFITDDEAEGTYPLVGKMWITEKEQLKYDLQVSGNKLSGTWKHSSFKAGECTIPEESGEVTGEIKDSEKKIVLRYARIKYLATNSGSLFGDDYCAGVKAKETKETETVFRGPLPRGGIMAVLSGIHWYWPGGFSSIQTGWTGHLIVSDVNPNAPAFAAGLRAEDMILAINGVEVKGLPTAQEAILLLRGDIGSEVVLDVLHKGEEKSVTLRFKRVNVWDYVRGKSWVN